MLFFFLTLQLSNYILEFLNFEPFPAYLIVVGSDTVPLWWLLEINVVSD